jgi:6-phosphogluconate dehydrogenase (decarboxylating)
MKIGMIGLGKLGMPVALGMNLKGHDVMGYGKPKLFPVFK